MDNKLSTRNYKFYFLDLRTCSLLYKISLNPLMSLWLHCSFETAHSPHFRKQRTADIPA